MGRYDCQVLMYGADGQAILSKSSVAIVGVGALGTHLADILVRAGVGRLHLIDFDLVDEKNLHRQTLFSETDVGNPKAEVAANLLRQINSKVKIEFSNAVLSAASMKLLEHADIIADCTDNLKSRRIVDNFSLKNKIPWVHAAVVKDYGSVMSFVYTSADKESKWSPIFSKKKSPDSCSVSGILPNMPSMITSIQASEIIKILLGDNHEKRLIRIDGKSYSISLHEV